MIWISVDFYFPYRKADYRTGANSHILKDNAPEFVIGNKDLDNLLKPLKDGLKGVVYSDDKQIVMYTNIVKKYSESPRTIVNIGDMYGN
jgi:Holliday junction resolvase RusA-like endonuclease